MPPPSRPTPDEYRTHIRDGIDAGDWRTPYEGAKAWISSGGGARQLDPWLAYVAVGLLKGEPRTAVHAIDKAMTAWIDDDADRAVLHWVRSWLLRIRIKYPKTALADLDEAVKAAPAWLLDRAVDDLAACRAEAEKSRKTKASFPPAPSYVGGGGSVPPPSEDVAPGSVPALWADLERVLTA